MTQKRTMTELSTNHGLMQEASIKGLSKNSFSVSHIKNTILKLVSTIFYHFFYQSDSPSKTVKNVISSKKLFSFWRYSNFCNFLPSFPHYPDSKGQMEVE